MSDTHIFLAAVGGYLLGSIPFGLVITRVAGLGDIRMIGSGNIGATNVLRTGNKTLALLTIILDSGKGAAATCIVIAYGSFEAGLIAGFSAVLGHNFPVWLKFRGGKGVATTLGVLLIASWHVVLATCVAWLLIAGLFRYSSLASLGALAASVIFAEYLATRPVTYLAAGLALLALIRHRENIIRLISGQESRFGNKSRFPTEG